MDAANSGPPEATRTFSRSPTASLYLPCARRLPRGCAVPARTLDRSQNLAQLVDGLVILPCQVELPSMVVLVMGESGSSSSAFSFRRVPSSSGSCSPGSLRTSECAVAEFGLSSMARLNSARRPAQSHSKCSLTRPRTCEPLRGYSRCQEPHGGWLLLWAKLQTAEDSRRRQRL